MGTGVCNFLPLSLFGILIVANEMLSLVLSIDLGPVVLWTSGTTGQLETEETES